MKRTSLLLIIGILAVVLVGGYTGYLFWQKSVVVADLARVERNLTQVQKQSLEFKNESILESIKAKEALPLIQMKAIKWSQVIEDILQTVPRSGGSDLVQILSYSGSATRDISINVRTNPERDELYLDAADLIEAFDDSQFFDEVFVPSIAAGTDDEGREVLTFVLSANYMEEKPFELDDSGLEEEVTDILNESLGDSAETSDGSPILR